MEEYNPKKIEVKWQKYWEKKGMFATPKDATPENKMYILPQLPYPSASGLHVGHAEVYTACDIYARYQRMAGKKVLQVIGWDSFGLPAENYAIRTNVHPRASTDKAIDNFRAQIKALGISVDWEREVGAHNPDYYKWTQWFFLLFYKRGLAYRKKQSVNWCSGCQTVLANEQVIEGKCERCETVVEQREMEQWFLKITAYADRLLEGLDRIDWPEETKRRQRAWIGKSEGALVRFKIKDLSFQIEVFTTRPDTLFGATYMVLAPEHLLVQSSEFIANRKEVDEYIEKTKKKTELERQTQKEKTGIELKGIKAINPATNEEIPVYIADYVLATYGTGSIMAVPAHDERDFEFANKFGLKVINVVTPWDFKTQSHPRLVGSDPSDDPQMILKEIHNGKRCYEMIGKSVNSNFLNGLSTKEAIEKMINWLEANKLGERKTQYKLRDWSVSRQRFWGAPIPMLYDDKNQLQPVPENDLPVLLPDDVDFKPTGESPLLYSKKFQKDVEKKYGKGWKREADTLDTFMCSSWYYYRYLDPKNNKEFASRDKIELWMGPRKKAGSSAELAGATEPNGLRSEPEGGVDFYLGGEEHVNGHLLYSRFLTKVLFDAGYIDFDEPFLTHRHQGLILGEDNRKMSKRWGNVINPTDVVAEYGADTLRLYEMFMGPLEQTKPWSTDGVKGLRRFLDKVWRLAEKAKDKRREMRDYEGFLHKTIKKVGEDLAKLRFNTAIAKLMELARELAKSDMIDKQDFEVFLKLLAPFAPHITEELWQRLGHKKSIMLEPWPKYDAAKIIDDTITLAVQINGKLRATIEVEPDITQEEAEMAAREHENVKRWLEGKPVKKIIYVKNKMLSFVV